MTKQEFDVIYQEELRRALDNSLPKIQRLADELGVEKYTNLLYTLTAELTENTMQAVLNTLSRSGLLVLKG